MTVEYLEHALRRAHTYAGFRRHLLHRPGDALTEYHLSAEEEEALAQHDRARLARLGVAPWLIDWWCAVAAADTPAAG